MHISIPVPTTTTCFARVRTARSISLAASVLTVVLSGLSGQNGPIRHDTGVLTDLAGLVVTCLGIAGIPIVILIVLAMAMVLAMVRAMVTPVCACVPPRHQTLTLPLWLLDGQSARRNAV